MQLIVIATHFDLFSTYRRFMTPLRQTTFENIVGKGEISHKNQFHLLSQCFQLHLTTKLSFIEHFHISAYMISKSSAAYLLYAGMG